MTAPTPERPESPSPEADGDWLFDHVSPEQRAAQVQRLVDAARDQGRREGRDAAAWAAERLCRIYFDIAAEAIGADEVRIRRDHALADEEPKG